MEPCGHPVGWDAPRCPPGFPFFPAMPTVHVPSLLRDLTGEAEAVEVHVPAGAEVTVDDLLRRMDVQYPGFRERLLYLGDLMPGIAVFIDGQQGFMKLQEKVGANSHVHFLPPIVGG